MQINQIIQMTQSDLETVVSGVLSEKAKAEIYERYYSVLIPASWVAKIHGVSYQTVFRYIQRGLITPEERSSREEHYLFRLSDVLKMDFKLLQKQLRKNKV